MLLPLPESQLLCNLDPLQPSSDNTLDRSSTPDGATRPKKKFMPGPPRAKLTTNITDTTKVSVSKSSHVCSPTTPTHEQ